jgi:hypothetical protein
MDELPQELVTHIALYGGRLGALSLLFRIDKHYPASIRIQRCWKKSRILALRRLAPGDAVWLKSKNDGTVEKCVVARACLASSRCDNLVVQVVNFPLFHFFKHVNLLNDSNYLLSTSPDESK